MKDREYSRPAAITAPIQTIYDNATRDFVVRRSTVGSLAAARDIITAEGGDPSDYQAALDSERAKVQKANEMRAENLQKAAANRDEVPPLRHVNEGADLRPESVPFKATDLWYKPDRYLQDGDEVLATHEKHDIISEPRSNN